MCKHNLRTMLKTKVIPGIAFWEMLVWSMVCGWIIIWRARLDEQGIYNKLADENGVANLEQQRAVEELWGQELIDWNKGVWVHTILALLFVPVAGILFGGVARRSRLMVLTWMFLNMTISILRIWAFIAYSKAYEWLRWMEFYWIFRIYFLIVTGHYCLDLWSEDDSAEHIEAPLLIPLDDIRGFRGHQNYPEYPMMLDQRARVHGVGQHIPQHMDYRYVVHPYPESYEATDAEGKPVLVLDNPPYNPDTR